jgi:predicted dehydrogenase
MKALVVGLGSIGRRHARNWVRLGLGEVLVCRQTDRPLPEPLGVPAREFRVLDEALAEQPDVVLVTNPTSLHLATATRCRQVHTALVEKPISHTLEELKRCCTANGGNGWLQPAFSSGISRARAPARG